MLQHPTVSDKIEEGKKKKTKNIRRKTSRNDWKDKPTRIFDC
jgi:hypothetical protein